jgi:hypothetical protein
MAAAHNPEQRTKNGAKIQWIILTLLLVDRFNSDSNSCLSPVSSISLFIKYLADFSSVKNSEAVFPQALIQK